MKLPQGSIWRSTLVVPLVVGLIGGAAIAWVVIEGPKLFGGGSEQADAQRYTCGMHPQVNETGPGSCPICKMDLVPVAGSSDDDVPHVCPMHPEVINKGPGTCPICKMDLVPSKASAGQDMHTCPMHPEVINEGPGTCPICKMDLVPTKTSAGPSSAIEIDPTTVQNMGVVVDSAKRGDLVGTIRTLGTLQYDQERMVSVTTRYPGFVERVYVHRPGDRVRRGQRLLDVYSPELVQTQRELFSAIAYRDRIAPDAERERSRADGLVKAARSRLSTWGLTPSQISDIESGGTIVERIPVLAPISGVVMKRREGLVGMAIQPGLEVMHIADLTTLAMEVEVFEDQLAYVQAGDDARLEFDALPGQRVRGRVDAIQPEVDLATRSARMTVLIRDPEQRLRVGMSGSAEFDVTFATDAVVVPEQAVVRTGARDAVIVARGDGKFEPRDVELGPARNGKIVILSGVHEGESIVVSAQFLIDSEAQLEAALRAMVADSEDAPAPASGDHRHGQ